jgi:hypothetical protein
MAPVELPDGRRVSAVYDFNRDCWKARLESADRMAEGHWLHKTVANLLEIPRGTRSPDEVLDAVQRLAQRDTPIGPRVLCRCCGFLTLAEYGGYEICPVCRWEDDPTTIFEPGERGGPGPNHLSLTEGRRNFTEQGISKPRLKDRVTVRAPLPAERT